MTLPILEDLLGSDAYRLRGISGWPTLSELGAGNLSRLEALASKNIHLEMMSGGERSTLREMASGVRELGTLTARHKEHRPFLPRLRNELFTAGDDVVVYLGDTPGGVPGWRRARVDRVEKAYQSSWARDSNARGYYWRVTVSDPQGTPMLPGLSTLSFSTTEPRVLLASEHRWLTQTQDTTFLDIFCENAWRTWTPIWCLEANLTCNTESMDMQTWLGAPVL